VAPPDSLGEERSSKNCASSSQHRAQGRPSDDLVKLAIENRPAIPAKSWPLNRELSQLPHLPGSAGCRGKPRLARQGAGAEEQIHLYPRPARSEVGLDDGSARRAYFVGSTATQGRPVIRPETLECSRDVGRDYSDGASFPRFIANIPQQRRRQLSDSERAGWHPSSRARQ